MPVAVRMPPVARPLGILGLAGSAAQRLLDLCYPGVCAACEVFCDSSGPLCADCDRKLAVLEQNQACAMCAMPLTQQGDPCPWCRGKGLYPFKQIIRLAIFDEPLKNLIHRAKYHDRWPLAEVLADRLARRPQAQSLLASADRLIPIPLYFRRHHQRGYNQADVIARRLKHLCGKRVSHALARTRNTSSQTELHSHRAREENVRNAFALTSESSIRGKHIVLIDDVMTTGATLQSAGRELLKGKPASLSALVLAIADPKGRDFQSI